MKPSDLDLLIYNLCESGNSLAQVADQFSIEESQVCNIIYNVKKYNNLVEGAITFKAASSLVKPGNPETINHLPSKQYIENLVNVAEAVFYNDNDSEKESYDGQIKIKLKEFLQKKMLKDKEKICKELREYYFWNVDRDIDKIKVFKKVEIVDDILILKFSDEYIEMNYWLKVAFTLEKLQMKYQ